MPSQRSHQPEWMDLGSDYYTPEEYQDCLFQLDRIGRFLGGDQATFKTLQQLPRMPATFLDVGCGGGLFALRLAALYPKAQIVGTDISPEAISFAQERLKEQPSLNNVKFLLAKSPQLNSSLACDVVLATLVCHHLSDEELIEFLKQARNVAKQAIVLNDLHRHPLASLGFALAVPLFFRNRMIWHDGLLSIRRSFTKKDWQSLLKAAGIPEKQYTIRWHWAFRWMVTIFTNS